MRVGARHNEDYILLFFPLLQGKWELAQNKQMRMQLTLSRLETNRYRKATKVLSSGVVGGVVEGKLQMTSGWALKPL